MGNTNDLKPVIVGAGKEIVKNELDQFPMI